MLRPEKERHLLTVLNHLFAAAEVPAADVLDVLAKFAGLTIVVSFQGKEVQAAETFHEMLDAQLPMLKQVHKNVNQGDPE